MNQPILAVPGVPAAPKLPQAKAGPARSVSGPPPPNIAKVGFCRMPAFYLPVAGSRPPEMAL
jgi:hypothetical protein